MKKLIYMLIGLGLLVSCTEEPDSGSQPQQFDTASGLYGGEGAYSFDGLAAVERVYNLSWVADRQEVDTASFYQDPQRASYMIVSHLPMAYFLNLLGKPAEPSQISYRPLSGWEIELTLLGYSASNQYLQNSTWAPRVEFMFGGEDYSCIVYMDDENKGGNWKTDVVYDYVRDIWTGSVYVYRLDFVNLSTNERLERTFSTPLALTFQTTGRRR